MKVLGDLARKGRWVILINFDSHVINILHFWILYPVRIQWTKAKMLLNACMIAKKWYTSLILLQSYAVDLHTFSEILGHWHCLYNLFKIHLFLFLMKCFLRLLRRKSNHLHSFKGTHYCGCCSFYHSLSLSSSSFLLWFHRRFLRLTLMLPMVFFLSHFKDVKF